MIKLFYTLSLSILVLNIYGQQTNTATKKTNKISGFVLNQKTNLPIGYATITILNFADSTIFAVTLSDTSGFFSISTPFQSGYYIKATSMGYKQKVIRSSLSQNDDSTLPRIEKIYLNEDVTFLKNIKITEKRHLIEAINGGYLYNADLNLSSTNGTVRDFLRNLPGVTLNSYGEILFRGNPGVNIYIDGRPTHLASSDLANYLQQLNANDIKSIAVYDNPSAKFDASGTAGIIDIKFKSNTINGRFGDYSIGAATHDKYNFSFRGNLKQKRLSFYINPSFRHENYRSYTSNNYENKTNPDSAYYYRYSNESTNRPADWLNINSGLDYSFDSVNTINTTVQFIGYRASNPNNLIENIFNKANQIQSSYSTNQVYKFNGDRFIYDLNYTHKFKFNKQITFDFNSYYFTRKELRNLTTSHFSSINLPIGSPINENRNNDLKTLLVSFSTDYEQKIRKSDKLQFGLKVLNTNNSNNFVNEFFDFSTQRYILSPLSSNVFHYNEGVYSAYTSFLKVYKKFSLQLGVRSEITNLAFKSDNINNKNTDSTYINYFPSFQLKYSVNKSLDVSFNIGRRIDRPPYFYFNPFIDITNPKVEKSGNPYLRPSLSTNYSIFVTKRLNEKHMIISAINLYVIKNAFEYFTQKLGDIYINSPQNFKESRYLGVFFDVEDDFFKFWHVSTNFSFFKTTYDASNLNVISPNKLISSNISMSNNLPLKKTLSIQLNASYQSPGNLPGGRYAEVFTSDFALRKNFPNKKILLSINLSDIFNTARLSNNDITTYLQSQNYTKYESRVLSIRVSKNFGKRIDNHIRHINLEDNSRLSNN